MVVFEIESWARSGDRLSNLLYHRVRMAKEVQLHMWISFLEGVVTALRGQDDRRHRPSTPEATWRIRSERPGDRG